MVGTIIGFIVRKYTFLVGLGLIMDNSLGFPLKLIVGKSETFSVGLLLRLLEDNLLEDLLGVLRSSC